MSAELSFPSQINFLLVLYSEPPLNCRFDICDANVDLKRYSASSFNVIHIRAMLQGVKNFHEIFYHTHRMLRPGGVLLVLEPLPALFDANKDLIQARTPDDEVRAACCPHRRATIISTLDFAKIRGSHGSTGCQA